MTPIVNIVSNIRISEIYCAAYCGWIRSLIIRNWKLGGIIIICDEVPNHGPLFELKQEYPCVQLHKENAGDNNCLTLADKTLQWASLCNQGIEVSLGLQSDFTLFVEPDLCIPIDVIDLMVQRDLDIVAPVPFLGAAFYDSWGFRQMNGEKVTSLNLPTFKNELIELSSVGSCVLFRTQIFERGVRFRGPYEHGLLVGVCNDAKDLGYRVWADLSVSVIHPTSLWRSQVWRLIAINLEQLDGSVRNFTANIIVPGHYPEFLRPIIEQSKESLSRAAGIPLEHLDSYELSITKDTDIRTLSVTIKAKLKS